MKFDHKYYFGVLIVMIGMLMVSCTSRKKSNLDYVNPFIGTGAHGHTYPGATVPFGFVQLSPDTRLEGWDGCSGYHYSDSVVYGFSHRHLSGTGILDYGDILFMPTTGEIQYDNGYEKSPDQGYASRFSHDQEEAAPGYYGVYLKDYDQPIPKAILHTAILWMEEYLPSKWMISLVNRLVKMTMTGLHQLYGIIPSTRLLSSDRENVSSGIPPG